MTSPPPGARPVDRDSALPLWAQVHDDLARRLTAGEFDGAFPGEFALVQQYGVSRHTIREALRRLRSDGRVVAGRGRPSRPAPREIDQPLDRLYSLFAAVEAVGQRQHSIVRALDLRTDEIAAAHLGLAPRAALVYLERVRLADGEPLAFDRAWLPATIAVGLLDADFTHTALYDELAGTCGHEITGGREQYRAAVPTAAERCLLGLDETVAVFTIDRLARSGEQAVEWRHTVVRGDRFTVSAEFTARAGYRFPAAVPA
ncbi:GntR family transcriptional regulator [Pilimelia anulata]|uniref:GntR family transcriptional regulator n=1 Tax=Pilimelia anulata TaxID=53371 RepID=A0A8J3F8L9_9ACTN|nr:GntR family transcriptional regulator [Pilimelia anulata]GGJ79562.1 GntR family transcriptional regulator [Pilimelia anulata]